MSNQPVYDTRTQPFNSVELAALKEGDKVVVKNRYHSHQAQVTKVTKAHVTVLEVNASRPDVFIIRSGRLRGQSSSCTYTSLHPTTPGAIQAKLAEKAVANVDNKTESLQLRIRKLRQLARDGYVSVDDAAAIETAFNQLYTLVSAHIPEGATY